VREGVDGYLINSINDAVNKVHQLDQIDRHDCRQRAIEFFSSDRIVEQYELLCKNSLINTGYR
jgi:hypothetical protein